MSSVMNAQSSTLHRIDGKLHSTHTLKDKNGRQLGTVTKRLKVEFHLEDVGQLIAGAFVMALPVALAEEVWDLGASLSTIRIMMILLLSVTTLAIFVWALFYGSHAAEYKGYFLRRVVTAYLLTFLVSLVLLMLFDKAPLDDPGLAMSRAIIVAFPAAFAATAVDFIN